MSCAHFFCQFCYGKYIDAKLEEGIVEGLTCPASGCTKPLDPIFFRVLECNYPLYMLLIVQNSLKAMKNSKWCPGRGCDRVVTCNDGLRTCFSLLPLTPRIRTM